MLCCSSLADVNKPLTPTLYFIALIKSPRLDHIFIIHPLH